jgi:hypothetical protein
MVFDLFKKKERDHVWELFKKEKRQDNFAIKDIYFYVV